MFKDKIALVEASEPHLKGVRMKTFVLFARLMWGLLVAFVFLTNSPLWSQTLSHQHDAELPWVLERQNLPKTFFPNYQASEFPATTAMTDWRRLIDSTWGQGLTTDKKLAIFENFYSTIDVNFACFQDLSVDWFLLYAKYVNEITGGVSRGRFAAIINHMALALKEAHTFPGDILVNFQTTLRPGVPLMVAGAWGFNTHFGAGLTPLPDSSLLVYQAVPNHPLGLQAGDIVLGYDGKPWKQLYRELLAAELPLTGFWWGCAPSAYEHSWLMSAGMNWHLFKTLDYIKYGTSTVTHFPVAGLIGQNNRSIFCSEQLDIAGVPKPSNINTDVVSYGIIEGTNLGYIYVWGWYANAGPKFLEAVRALMFDRLTSGLIIDFRMNYGGNMFLSYDALSLLFNTTHSTIGLAERCDPADHLKMCPSADGPPSAYVIRGSTEDVYDKPIAVLVGPGAVSSGDQVSNLMKFHPHARFFGKSTTAAFNSPVSLNLDPTWSARYAAYDAYYVTAPNRYLTHDEFPVDEHVWLTPDDVVKGKDTVVERARAWIAGQLALVPQALTISGGNGDSNFTPGETVNLTITLKNTNTSGANASAITARLRAVSNLLTINTGNAAFQDIPVNTTGDNAASPFTITASANAPLGAVLAELTITATNVSGGAPYEVTHYLKIDIVLNQSGWPQAVAGEFASGNAVRDLDRDGSKEVIATSRNGKVYVWNAQGQLRPSFPFSTGAEISTSPAIGDMNRDGDLDIVVTSRDKNLYVINHDGSLQAQRNINEDLRGTPSLSDLDGDGVLEIVFGTFNGKLFVLHADGSNWKSFPKDLGATNRILGGVAIGDVNADGVLDLVAGTSTGQVHAISSATGNALPGFPVSVGQSIWASPAIGKLASGQATQIVIAENTGKIVLVNSDGSLAKTVMLSGRIEAAPTLADIDGDGSAEIIIGTLNNLLYVLRRDGTNAPGFPRTLGNTIRSSFLVADLDNKAGLELVGVATDGGLYAMKNDATFSTYFPIMLGGALRTTPSIDDVDDDGDLELVVGGLNAMHLIDIPTPGANRGYWFTEAGNYYRTSNYQDAGAVRVQEQPSETSAPKAFALAQNYPNPFNPSTMIQYEIPQAAQVRLAIHNLLGERVRTLVDAKESAGVKQVTWDGRDERGEHVSSGVYVYRIEAGEFRLAKRLLLMK